MIATNDFNDMTVLVTGGTRGIGLATALAFAERGSQCVITHRWGTTPEDEVLRRFSEIGAKPPLLVECDVADMEAVGELLDQIGTMSDQVDVFVSNVAYGQPVSSLRQLKLRGLNMTIERSTWPIVSHTYALQERFGRFPRYVIGMSSTGHIAWTGNYDLIAASKSALEIITMYMASRLYNDGCRVNIIRPAAVDTDSSEMTLGRAFLDMLSQERPSAVVSLDAVADCVIALCSGLMDEITGQVIDVHKGEHLRKISFIKNRYQQTSSEMEVRQ